MVRFELVVIRLKTVDPDGQANIIKCNFLRGDHILEVLFADLVLLSRLSLLLFQGECT